MPHPKAPKSSDNMLVLVKLRSIQITCWFLEAIGSPEFPNDVGVAAGGLGAWFSQEIITIFLSKNAAFLYMFRTKKQSNSKVVCPGNTVNEAFFLVGSCLILSSWSKFVMRLTSLAVDFVSGKANNYATTTSIEFCHILLSASLKPSQKHQDSRKIDI